MNLGPTLRRFATYGRREDGAAAVEMAIWLIVLVPAMLNGFDLGIYIYQQMQVKHAAQMAAQAAFTSCGQQGYTSVSSKCSGFTATINTAAQYSTSLGTNVSASATENDYCVDPSTGTLTTSGCSSTAHYLLVTATFTYTPLFRGMSMASLLPSTISQTSWIRMG
jgi:Flp pilus assembly protein TadG